MTYKTEKWKKTLWKGTQRETTTTKDVLVNRDKNGRFTKNKPVISEVKEKTYASGVYKVGIVKGKVVTRQKIAGKETPQYEKTKKETLKNMPIFRCSLALNDIPYKGNDYYGFRIIAFSRSKKQLEQVYPQKMYKKLIDFIAKCLKYREDEFWFNHYLNYMGKIQPEQCNASMRDSGKYDCLWTRRKTGTILREDHGVLSQL